MKNERPLKFWAVVFIAASTFALVATTLLTSQGYEKICPITFRLYPGTLLEENYAAKIEKHNAKLSEFLSELRSDSNLRKWMEDWSVRTANLKTGDDQGMKIKINELHGLLKDKNYADPFTGTYLAEPKLTTEQGVTVIGIPAVLVELGRIIEGSTYVDAQSVHVELQYLPYGSPEYIAANAANPTAEERYKIDIIAHIKTVLAYAPYDAPVIIEGMLPHRKICDPIY